MTGIGFCVILIIVWRPLSIIRETLIIGSDNNETNFHSYYRLEALTDNKEFVMFSIDNKDTHANRAGSYVSQSGGYKAFVPKPLPPDPPLRIDSEMIQLLAQAFALFVPLFQDT